MIPRIFVQHILFHPVDDGPQHRQVVRLQQPLQLIQRHPRGNLQTHHQDNPVHVLHNTHHLGHEQRRRRVHNHHVEPLAHLLQEGSQRRIIIQQIPALLYGTRRCKPKRRHPRFLQHPLQITTPGKQITQSPAVRPLQHPAQLRRKKVHIHQQHPQLLIGQRPCQLQAYQRLALLPYRTAYGQHPFILIFYGLPQVHHHTAQVAPTRIPTGSRLLQSPVAKGIRFAVPERPQHRPRIETLKIARHHQPVIQHIIQENQPRSHGQPRHQPHGNKKDNPLVGRHGGHIRLVHHHKTAQTARRSTLRLNQIQVQLLDRHKHHLAVAQHLLLILIVGIRQRPMLQIPNHPFQRSHMRLFTHLRNLQLHQLAHQLRLQRILHQALYLHPVLQTIPQHHVELLYITTNRLHRRMILPVFGQRPCQIHLQVHQLHLYRLCESRLVHNRAVQILQGTLRTLARRLEGTQCNLRLHQIHAERLQVCLQPVHIQHPPCTGSRHRQHLLVKHIQFLVIIGNLFGKKIDQPLRITLLMLQQQLIERLHVGRHNQRNLRRVGRRDLYFEDRYPVLPLFIQNIHFDSPFQLVGRKRQPRTLQGKPGNLRTLHVAEPEILVEIRLHHRHILFRHILVHRLVVEHLVIRLVQLGLFHSKHQYHRKYQHKTAQKNPLVYK